MDSPPPFDPIRHRRGGRKRKPEDKRLCEIVKIRITPEKLAEMKARADEVCMSLSEYGRATFENNPVRVTVAQRAPPEVIREMRIMSNDVKEVIRLARLGTFDTPELEAAAVAAMQAIATEFRRLLYGVQGEPPD